MYHYPQRLQGLTSSVSDSVGRRGPGDTGAAGRGAMSSGPLSYALSGNGLNDSHDFVFRKQFSGIEGDALNVTLQDVAHYLVSTAHNVVV